MEKGYPCFAVRYLPGSSNCSIELISGILTEFIREEDYALLERVKDEMHRKRRDADEEIVRLMKEIQAEMEGKPRTKKVTVKEVLIYDDVEVPADLEGQDLEDFAVDQIDGHENWHVEQRYITE